MVIIVSFLPELLEFSEDRHPWESVEEKLHEIRYTLLVVYVFRSFVHPSLLPSRLFSSLPLSFCSCLSLPPCPLSVFTFLSAPISIPPSLPLRLTPPFSSLSRYLTTVVSFFAPAIFPSLPASFFLSLNPFSLSFRSCFAPFLLFSLLTPLPSRSSLFSLDKLTNDISLAHCISLWFVFCFSFSWTTVLISIPFSET